MAMKIVFPVAGVGTRFLPATKEIPKEILPVIDKPLIQYAVEEAVQSGLADFIFITARGKEALEKYFAPNPELDDFLERHNKSHLLDGLQEFYNKNFSYIRQEKALGFGHAIALAEKVVGDEPFAISLPDDLILSKRPAMAQLLDIHKKFKSPVIAFMEVPRAEIPRYGIAAGTFLEDRVFAIEKLVEKPAIADAPSNFAVIGRYIMTPDIFPLLKETAHGAGAEIQLTDAVIQLMKKRRVLGYFFEGRRFDAGTTLGYIETLIHVALSEKTPANSPAGSCVTWQKMGNYEIFATTADAGIRFKGRDYRGLYENALRGLNLLLFGPGRCKARGHGTSHFSYRGDGPESVLVNFLAEVLSLVYQEKQQVLSLAFVHADGCRLEAELRLAPCLDEPKLDIKSVTYHNLRVLERNGMKSAAIVFDI
jgi:UTP--glucose-1-phosphate uridylyltransferase